MEEVALPGGLPPRTEHSARRILRGLNYYDEVNLTVEELTDAHNLGRLDKTLEAFVAERRQNQAAK